MPNTNRKFCLTAAVLMGIAAASPIHANETVRRERGGGMGVGTGLAIGIGTGIIVNELNKRSEPPSTREPGPKKPRPVTRRDDRPNPCPPRIDALLKLGAPKFSWHGFDIYPNGDVRKHEDAPKECPAPPDGKKADDPKPTTPDDEKTTKCIVTAAELKYAGQIADAPLQLPAMFTAPAPGTNPANQLGPSRGIMPDGKTLFAGNAFEYHSDLNNQHGCSSNQYKIAWLLSVRKANGLIKDVAEGPDGKPLNFKFNTATQNAGSWKEDRSRPGDGNPVGRGAYDGNTGTGVKNAYGVPTYQGTKQRIHWVDAPGWARIPDNNNTDIFVNVALLRSQTIGTDRAHGWFCLSGHTVVMDGLTGQPLGLDDARKALNDANAKGGTLQKKAAAEVLKAGAAGLTANPQFQNLGCYKF